MRPGRPHIIYYLLATVIITACNKTDVQQEPASYELQVPANFPAVSRHADNPLTQEGIALGRRLFYDKRLSGNNSISCASCHRPEKAFSDGMALSSSGVSGTMLHRHSPALINLLWAENGLFWDGGSTNLESQAFGPLTAHDEMGQNLLEMENELKEDPWYLLQFQLAFGDTIKSANVVKALAQFQRTLISAGSRYDRYTINQDAPFTIAEAKGLQIVTQKCAPCHQAPLFTDNDFHNNGIDADYNNDSFERIFQGRSRITYLASDLGKFKTPTLRNIMLTAPYMHDGRFANMEAVLTHYSDGVKFSSTLDHHLLKNEGKPGITLDNDEKNCIIAFLHTLTDSAFVHNKQLSDPI